MLPELIGAMLPCEAMPGPVLAGGADCANADADMVSGIARAAAQAIVLFMMCSCDEARLRLHNPNVAISHRVL